MYRNALLLLFCIAILGIVNVTEYKNAKKAYGQAQTDELVSGSTSLASAVTVSDIDPNIILEPSIEPSPIEVEVDIPRKEPSNKNFISAEEFLVGNIETGEVYLEFNVSKVFPIASLSKLYTALVVHHLFDLDQKITITPQMLKAYGSAGNLKTDEKFTPNELLHALLLESSNDAADAYAYTYGYEKFIEEMNAFAKEIGMDNTSFEDASGLSPRNVSNAEDLFALSRYLYASEQDILDISKKTKETIKESADHVSHTFVNINPFSKNPNFIGGKTGRTDQAKESMVSLFNKTINGTTYPIAVIVLRSDFGERETNTEKLVNMFVDKILKTN
jgi:D-alanyl-D-alanine carboxypeptidase